MDALIFANILEDSVGPIVDGADALLRWFHDSVGLGWGFSIVMMTVTVRLVMVPLTYKQIKSMMRMQEFQPAIKELQEKYKDDPQRKNKEMMAFFAENKINPAASCLPLLLQLPVFIGLFYALQDKGLQKLMSDEGFYLISSLVDKPRGFELVVLMVLYVGSQIGASLVSSATMDPMQRKIMLGLPLIFVPVVANFPAGLSLYWITTNFWTFGQAFVIRHMRHKHNEGVEERKLVTDAQASTSTAAVEAPGSGTTKVAKQAKTPPPPPRRRKKRSGRRR